MDTGKNICSNISEMITHYSELEMEKERRIERNE